MKCQNLFSVKNKTNIINLLSAEYAHRVNRPQEKGRSLTSAINFEVKSLNTNWKQSTFKDILLTLRKHAYWNILKICPRTSIVRGNCVRETSVKRRNKIVQEKTRNVANVFRIYTIIAIEHGSSMHLHSPGPFWGVFNTPRNLANVNAWKKPCLIPIL